MEGHRTMHLATGHFAGHFAGHLSSQTGQTGHLAPIRCRTCLGVPLRSKGPHRPAAVRGRIGCLDLKVGHQATKFVQSGVSLDPVGAEGNDADVAWHIAQSWDQPINRRAVIFGTANLHRHAQHGADCWHRDVALLNGKWHTGPVSSSSRFYPQVSGNVSFPSNALGFPLSLDLLGILRSIGSFCCRLIVTRFWLPQKSRRSVSRGLCRNFFRVARSPTRLLNSRFAFHHNNIQDTTDTYNSNGVRYVRFRGNPGCSAAVRDNLKQRTPTHPAAMRGTAVTGRGDRG